MKSVYIKIKTVDDVYTLVETLLSYDGDVDLESDRYKVDGKSFLGILSLNLRRPIKMTLLGDGKSDELLEKLSGFLVDGPEG